MHCTSLSSGNQVDGSPLAISLLARRQRGPLSFKEDREDSSLSACKKTERTLLHLLARRQGGILVMTRSLYNRSFFGL